METISDLQTVIEEIQRADDQLEQRYRPLLKLNKELDRTLVSFQANKAARRHRWCKYKEGFSAALMTYVFEKAGIKSGRVLDPFAGSGTALFVAAEHGINATGIELLPSSSEIIKVRDLIENVHSQKLVSELKIFLRDEPWLKQGKVVPVESLRITEGAYPSETERQLGRFLFEAKLHKFPDMERILRFAALCILESISYTRKDGQYLRWDARAGRRVGAKPFDKGKIFSFDEAIKSKLSEIIHDLEHQDEGFFGHVEKPEKRGSIELIAGSCLEVLPKLSASKFNGIITSPPYCNRYDYTRTYALELALMGVGEEELKNLRQTMLTCTVENRQKESLKESFRKSGYAKARKAFLAQETLQLIIQYLYKCKDDGKLNNTGIPRMVENYFWEMALVINECARVLKPGAPFIMVNDNVRYQGVHIPVDLILSDFAKSAGLDVEVIWVLPIGKGNSSQQMGLHGRTEIRKCVYVWRKPITGRAKKPSLQSAQAL